MVVRGSRHRGARVALGVGALLVLLLVLSQVFLPSLAAKLVSNRLARYGTVKSVSVSAWPALELLLGRADSATLATGALSVPSSKVASLLWEGHNVTNVTMSASTATVTSVPSLPRGFTVSDMHIEKRGAAIQTSATLTALQLQEALPSGFSIEPLASGNGQVEARASGGLFGIQASIVTLVKPLEGRLVAEPEGFPLASLATVTLFSDPHLKVESVGVRVLRTQPLTYGLSMSASLV
jgi:hypothetical protein